MKKSLKKALSLLMSIVLVATLIPANAANPSAVQDVEKEVAYNATNSLGEVLSQAMDADAEENNGYFIQDVTVDGLDAEVQISAPDGTTLVVAVYDEKSGEMITSGEAAVDSLTETSEVTFGECDMPEYFVVKAFLLDENNAPVCQNYEGLTYTEAYQEFLAKTTDDFDEEKVINLDSGKESNFAVVSDETVTVEKTLGKNTIVTDDYENGVYEFENADGEIKSLEVGDVLYYVYGDGPEDYVLTKVGKIEVNGDNVVIEAADDAEISDLFSYIKIDTSKAVEEEPVMSGAHYDDDSGDMDDSSAEFKISVTKEFESSEHVSASFSGELSVKFYLQFYYDYNLFKEDYYELTETTTVSFNGTTEIKAEAEHKWEPLILFHGGIPVYAGLEAEVTLVLQIKVAAQISVSGGIEIKLVGGSRKVSGKPEEDLSKDPSVKLKFSIEGKATFDIIPSFSVGLKILKVFKISGEVSTDLCISATATIIDSDKINDGIVHNCALCMDGDVTATFSINIKFQFGLNKKKQKTILNLQLFSASRKLGDFYISFIALDDGSLSFADFGFGECPFCEYKVTFNVVDENGKSLEKVKISDDVNTIETDSKGKAYCYYKDGTYTYNVTCDGYEIDTLKMNFDELVFVVHGDTVTVNVYMKKTASSPTVPSAPETPNESGVRNSGTCGDNLTWVLYNDGELVISGTGEMYDWTSFSVVPWYNNSSKIKSVTIGNSVTSIGDRAFNSCDRLTSITIPNSVTSIGYGAFSSCGSLTSITIPNSVTSIDNHVFYNCTNLTSITIPDGVTSIGYYAFYNCTNLTSIIIPDNVTSIGSYAFYYCESLTSVTIPDNVTSIDGYAFYNCDSLTSITIPDSVISIGDCAFNFCDNLTSISVDSANTVYSSDEYGVLFNKDKTDLIQYPIGNTRTNYVISDSVTSIGDSAFGYCKSLTSVTIPDGVTSIGYSAFYNCTNLTSVTIGNGVTSIGDSAFGYCKSLTSVTIPDRVTSIGYSAFYNCTNLTSVTIPDGVTSIGYFAFLNTAIYDDSSNWENDVLYIGNCLIDAEILIVGTYAIKDGTKVIADGAFNSCDNLTNVTIPDSVTSIGDEAFGYCKSLTSVTIPDGVTSIGDSAFLSTAIYNNSSNWKNGVLYIGNYLIKAKNSIDGSYVIKDGTKVIADSAFGYCKSLTSVTIPNSVTSIGDEAFESCRSLTSVTIPDSVTSIGDRAFNSCDNLTSITIPDGVTSIGEYAFYNCDSLASVTIGNGVTSIGEHAFAWCDGFTNVTIPDSVTSIGDYAFYNCHSLTSVTIGNGVKSIGDSAFKVCHSLTSITVDSANSSYSSDEYGVLFNKDKTVLIQYPEGNTRTGYVISDSVTSIGDYAFEDCSSLTSVTIPDSVTVIDDLAFYGCYSLTSIIIPDSVTSIGDRAFYFCRSLSSITIPDSVTSIGDYAFYRCDSLTNVYYTGTEEQWNKISIGSGNYYLTSANITYNYVIPETVSLNSTSNSAVLSGGSNSAKTVYNAQNGYFYTVMAVKDKSASDLLSNENLLFIDQKTAESSTLTFDVLVPEAVTDYEIIITTNSPDEPEDEPSVPPTEPSTKPVEVPATTKPAETEPSTKPVEVPTTTRPAETEPSTKPVEAPTTTKPAEIEPSTKPVEAPTTTKPAETEPSTKPVEVPTTTKPAETEPTTKPVEVPTTTKPVVTVPAVKVEIRKPSQTEIKYGDSIVLHAEAENLPADAKIEWSVDNANFTIVEVSADGKTCQITPNANGDTVITAKVVDAKGNEISKDEQTMTAKAGFFQKFVAFFKKLFGMTKVYPEIFKGLF